MSDLAAHVTEGKTPTLCIAIRNRVRQTRNPSGFPFLSCVRDFSKRVSTVTNQDAVPKLRLSQPDQS